MAGKKVKRKPKIGKKKKKEPECIELITLSK